MNGIIFLCLLNISHFISADCSEVMSKRTQKDSGEERVTAKSKPMMSLIAQSSERAPSALSSIASESPGKTRQESQSPLSAQAEMYDRTEKPVVCYDTSHERHRLAEKAHSSSYSEWNIDKTWSSQEWNGQHSAAGRQLTLDKAVGSRVWWHSQGLSELWLDPGWGPGQPGSGVAIDWVTGWLCSSAAEAGRRLNLQ